MPKKETVAIKMNEKKRLKAKITIGKVDGDTITTVLPNILRLFL